jgi:hypothetical protein
MDAGGDEFFAGIFREDGPTVFTLARLEVMDAVDPYVADFNCGDFPINYAVRRAPKASGSRDNMRTRVSLPLETMELKWILTTTLFSLPE